MFYHGRTTPLKKTPLKEEKQLHSNLLPRENNRAHFPAFVSATYRSGRSCYSLACYLGYLGYLGCIVVVTFQIALETDTSCFLNNKVFTGTVGGQMQCSAARLQLSLLVGRGQTDPSSALLF